MSRDNSGAQIKFAILLVAGFVIGAIAGRQYNPSGFAWLWMGLIGTFAGCFVNLMTGGAE